MNDRGLITIPSNLKPTVTHFSAAGNPISNFEGFPRFSQLVSLNLDNTNLSSFSGAVNQPALQILSFQRTPLAERDTHRLMASIVFSPSLKIINSKTLNLAERQARDQHEFAVQRDLCDGWLIFSVDPLILFHERTRKRRVVSVQRSIVPPRGPKKSRPSAKYPLGSQSMQVRRKRIIRDFDVGKDEVDWMNSGMTHFAVLGSESGFPVNLQRHPMIVESDSDGDWKEAGPEFERILPLGSESGFPMLRKPVPDSIESDDDDIDWRSGGVGQFAALGEESGFEVGVRRKVTFPDSDDDDQDDWKAVGAPSHVRALGSDSGFPVPAKGGRPDKLNAIHKRKQKQPLSDSD
jgi:hypothetical protein